MGPQHVRDGALHVHQGKTGTELFLPIDPRLQAVIGRCDHLTFITTKTGQSFKGNDFSDQFRKWCDAAGLPKDCTFHGLRHTLGHQLANAGATTHQIAAMTGHKSLSEVQRYTKSADQIRLSREAAGLLTKQRTR
jgi:integrase